MNQSVISITGGRHPSVGQTPRSTSHLTSLVDMFEQQSSVWQNFRVSSSTDSKRYRLFLIGYINRPQPRGACGSASPGIHSAARHMSLPTHPLSLACHWNYNICQNVNCCGQSRTPEAGGSCRPGNISRAPGCYRAAGSPRRHATYSGNQSIHGGRRTMLWTKVHQYSTSRVGVRCPGRHRSWGYTKSSGMRGMGSRTHDILVRYTSYFERLSMILWQLVGLPTVSDHGCGLSQVRAIEIMHAGVLHSDRARLSPCAAPYPNVGAAAVGFNTSRLKAGQLLLGFGSVGNNNKRRS
ncbi:uncharacterized protein BDV17DRAFT_230838 [Aspergillus undulatus]|uniref:uncharacterized protein n=1 Tax=Aspergillus undulatus TaxID=1810928 RepID=UPI003CCDC23C